MDKTKISLIADAMKDAERVAELISLGPAVAMDDTDEAHEVTALINGIHMLIAKITATSKQSSSNVAHATMLALGMYVKAVCPKDQLNAVGQSLAGQLLELICTEPT